MTTSPTPNDAAAPWRRADDGRPYLPDGAHWTDVPELVDHTIAGIQARVDQAQSGRWYTAPATETGLAPGTVRTRVNGYPCTVGQFTNVLPADLELILHAHDDLSWCLEMLAKARARAAELEEQIERRRMRLVKAETDLLEMRGLLSPNGRPRRIPPEVEIHERVTPAVEWLLARVAELEQHAAESRMSVVEDVANWLRSVGEDDAAYLVGTCDIPAGASPERLEDAAPSQVIPVVDDVPIPAVLTEQDGPAVVTAAARTAADKLRRDLPLPLSGGERS
ncbi:hypothetical protein [Streptomyces hygroscopicus]|uniref:hypothetical protein n=1 Tax=Streptomyces hygroscopicus TaxID=1912 RepID=UPI0033E1A5D6